MFTRERQCDDFFFIFYFCISTCTNYKCIKHKKYLAILDTKYIINALLFRDEQNCQHIVLYFKSLVNDERSNTTSYYIENTEQENKVYFLVFFFSVAINNSIQISKYIHV